MAYQNFDIGINEAHLVDPDILFDTDDMDDLLLTISPTAIQNQESHFDNVHLPGPCTNVFPNSIISDPDPEHYYPDPELPDPELPDPELPDPELPEPDIPDPELPDSEPDHESEDEDIPRKKFKEAQDDLRSFVHGNRNKSTISKTMRETERFKQYLISEGDIREMQDIPPEEMNIYVGEFIKNLKMLNGKDYEPDSVSSFFRCVFNIFCHKNAETISKKYWGNVGM